MFASFRPVWGAGGICYTASTVVVGCHSSSSPFSCCFCFFRRPTYRVAIPPSVNALYPAVKIASEPTRPEIVSVQDEERTRSTTSEFKLAVLAGSSTPDSTDLRQRPADYFYRDVTEYRGLDSYLYSLVY
jgi:hypothetical protein